MHTRRRAVLAALVAGVLLMPVAAAAHGVLLSSSPAANSNLTVAPTEVRLVFSERPERAFTRIALTSPGGVAVPLGGIVFGPGNVATARIAGPLASGVYTVGWQTLGSDGHSVSGSFSFALARDAVGIVAAPSAAAAASAPPTASASPAMRSPDLAPAATLLRWISLVAMVAAIGAVAFRVIVVRRLRAKMPADGAAEYIGPLERGGAIAGLVATLVLLVAAAAKLSLQLAAVGTLAQGGAGAGALLTGTMWGRGWLIQVAGAVIALPGFSAARRGRSEAWWVAATGAAAVMIGLSLSGHAVAVERLAAVTVLGHVIHGVAAASWLGTLLLIAAVALPLSFRLQREDRWRLVAEIVQAFSPVALTLAGITVLAGALIAWSHLGTPTALWTTEYGRVLLLKIALVAATAATGAYNWLRVRPSLGQMPGARRLRRSSAVELAFAGLVLAVTAVLLATPMPSH